MIYVIVKSFIMVQQLRRLNYRFDYGMLGMFMLKSLFASMENNI